MLSSSFVSCFCFRFNCEENSYTLDSTLTCHLPLMGSFFASDLAVRRTVTDLRCHTSVV
jgi:hypothetical protein